MLFVSRLYLLMKYQGSPSFTHSQTDKTGVLITNLGTPKAPTTRELRKYLHEFLSDPRVVEVPRLLWWMILHGIILRFRPRRSAKAYREIWNENGSPLLWHSQQQASALQQRLQSQYGDRIIVGLGMRYGQPSIKSAIDTLLQQGVRQLLVLPLYPQYSASTTASTFDALAADFTCRRWLPALRFITHYHDDPSFIRAAAAHIRSHWQQHGRADKILFSYHGVPLRYLHNGDPYHCECHKTSRLLAEALQLGKDEYLTTFQSRFGREPWLQPYTDETLKALPEQGCQSVQVFCPGFAADCLETIEEIDVENRAYFLENGGKQFDYIAALNAESVHIDALAQIVMRNLQGWEKESDSAGRAQRAQASGAEK